MRRSSGQATIEIVAFIPLVVLVVAAVVQFLAAGDARERAAAAAQAGAVALLEDGDPEAAVQDALGDAADRSTIIIDGHRVKVTVRPRAFAPPVAGWLEATASADAGRARAGGVAHGHPRWRRRVIAPGRQRGNHGRRPGVRTGGGPMRRPAQPAGVRPAAARRACGSAEPHGPGAPP